MSSLDRKVQRAVRAVLRRTGTMVTWTRVTVGAYTPGNMTVTTSSEDQQIRGRLDDYTDREMANAPSIRAGDRKLTIAALDVEGEPPDVDDQITIGTVPHSVVRVSREYGQDEPALYVLQLRS